MTRDDSRAQRFANPWLGLSFATLLGVGSTVELAAMPIPALGAQLLGPTLIQQEIDPQGEVQRPAERLRPPSADECRVNRASGRASRLR